MDRAEYLPRPIETTPYHVGRDPLATLSSQMAVGQAESKRPIYYVPNQSQEIEDLQQDLDALLFYFAEINK